MSPSVSYHDGKFPPSALEWDVLIPHLGPAAAAVARYDGTLAAVPNAGVLLSPLTTQEAVLSSRIEGTQASMSEVLEFEADASAPDLANSRRADILEVLNYRHAVRFAEERLAEIPLSLRLIREMHGVLLHGVRGQNSSPGEFRRTPNWIGAPSCPMEEARFVPIAADRLPAGLGVWERFIHADAPDRLVQLAILHAEFEALHPFLDGNGRIGRILIPLFLWQHGLIRQPMFYLSAYLETNRDEYYERLLAVSRDDDWTGWCRFFLEGVRRQADDNQKMAAAILALYEELKPRVMKLMRSQFSIHALDWIFQTPIFRSTAFIANAQIPDASARRLLAELKRHEIIRELSPGRGRRAATFVFPSLLNLTEGREIF
jgi:Fic family protein